MLTFSEKISYAVGRFGTSISMDMADLFTTLVYITFFGLKDDPFLAFLAVASGKFIIAFTSYFSGYISDKTSSRWGRRLPFVIFGVPILALAFFMLYTPYIWLPTDSTETMIFGYLLVFNGIYQALYGAIITPYQSLLPEITQDEEERLIVSGYQNTFNILAFLVGAGSSFLLPALLGIPSDEDGLVYGLENLSEPNKLFTFLTDGQLVTIVIITYAVIIILGYLPTILKIREKKEIFIPQPPIKEEIKIVTSNKNFMGWVASRSTLEITMAGLQGIILLWIVDVLAFDSIEYLMFGLVLISVILLSFMFWVKLGNNPNYGKTKSFIYSMSGLALTLPSISVAGQIDLLIPVLLQGLIVAFLGAITISCYYLLPYAITGDIAEEDELRTKESRAGHYYGFELFPMNFAKVAGFLFTGILLSLPDYTSTVTGNTFSFGYLLFGPIAAIIIVISVFIFWKYVDADPLRKISKN